MRGSRARARPAYARRISAPGRDSRGASPRDRFAVVKLRFEIPHTVYLYSFTRTHPNLLFVVTATQNLPENRVLTELDVIGSVPVDLTEELRGASGVTSVARLGSVGQVTRYQVIARRPSYLMLADRLEVLCRYPRVAEDGNYTVEAAARVSQLRELVRGLRKLTPHVRIMAFGRDLMRTSPPNLTPRQHALLHRALAAGYFDVPRRISLTNFARTQGRSKSSISQALAIIEKKLAEASVVSAG